MNNFINILKTVKWMLIIAIVIAIIFMFINPMYTIIFSVSGIMGFIIGLKCVSAIIPEDFDTWKNEWEAELKKILEQTKENDI